MIATIINTFTAPSETFETIVKDFNWKEGLMPLSLIMGLAIISGIILSDQIADLQWEQIQQSINNNTNISEEQKQEILGAQYDRVYSKSGASAIFTYISMALSWPIRILFWSLFSMLIGNLFLGGGATFGRVFLVASFAYLPSVLEYIIKTPIQYITENLMIFTGLGVLGIGEEGEFLNSLLAGIDLFAFWRVYLMSVGFSYLYNKSSNSTLSVLAGLWIFGLIVFAGMGSFFAGMAG